MSNIEAKARCGTAASATHTKTRKEGQPGDCELNKFLAPQDAKLDSNSAFDKTPTAEQHWELPSTGPSGLGRTATPTLTSSQALFAPLQNQSGAPLGLTRPAPHQGRVGLAFPCSGNLVDSGCSLSSILESSSIRALPDINVCTWRGPPTVSHRRIDPN